MQMGSRAAFVGNLAAGEIWYVSKISVTRNMQANKVSR